MRTLWTVLLTALCTALLTVLAIGAGRLWLGMSSAQHTVQRSCGSGALSAYCVQRTTLPAIPLLRAERTAIEVHANVDTGRYLTMPDPFSSAVDIVWGPDGVTLTADTGYALVLDRAFLRRLLS